MYDGKSPIEKAKEALRPFARVAETWVRDYQQDDDSIDDHMASVEITFADLRRAREALKALEGE